MWKKKDVCERSKWETPPTVVEKERAKILRDFQILSDRMVIVNQPDIVDKQQRKTIVVDMTTKWWQHHETLEKYQGLIEELDLECNGMLGNRESSDVSQWGTAILGR